jgi:hypothetical protein
MRLFFILIGIMTLDNMSSQDLKKHQWENRVLLIVAQNEDSKEYRNQIAALHKLQDELMERKVLVYCVLPQQYSIMNFETKSNNWTSSTTLFDEFADKKDGFKVILIGMDGGTKLERSEVLTASELFGTIDAMPMRRAELNRTKN